MEHLKDMLYIKVHKFTNMDRNGPQLFDYMYLFFIYALFKEGNTVQLILPMALNTTMNKKYRDEHTQRNKTFNLNARFTICRDF